MVEYIVLFVEMHQPRRISPHAGQRLVSLLGRRRITRRMLVDAVFDEQMDYEILSRVADNCYIPTFGIIAEENIKVALSVSGILLEFLEQRRPDVIDAIRRAASKGLVEFLCEPYHHSLAVFAGDEVFRREMEESRRILRRLFNAKPTVTFNTEGLYSDSIAGFLKDLGFEAVITEGVERVLWWRSPAFLYASAGGELRILLRHYWLSDDVGFRFSDKHWCEYPLTADKYASWIKSMPGEFVVIGFDIETFGEHFPRETGILEFLRWLPRELSRRGVEMLHPSEVLELFEPADELSFEGFVSWADREKDESAWLGNEMQRLSFESLLSARGAFEDAGCEKLWRMLLTSDHFYYMSTKSGAAGMVHGYFNPYRSPFKAFKYFTEALQGLLMIVSNRKVY